MDGYVHHLMEVVSPGIFKISAALYPGVSHWFCCPILCGIENSDLNEEQKPKIGLHLLHKSVICHEFLMSASL